MSMSYFMSPVDNGIDYFPDESLYASMDVGSNGNPYGDPTFAAGDDQGEEVWGFGVWDSNTSNGFDTGNVPVAFAGASNGNETLEVGQNAPISYAGDSFGSITSVDFQAAVMVPATASWSNITVDFYNGSELVENDSIGTGPAVNTINTPNSPQAEQVLIVSPPVGSTITNVVATGTMRMTAPNAATLGSSSMFCSIFVNG
jgi:hypothetical protein